MTTKRKPTCATCGGSDIIVDAWAEWDEGAGDWVLKVAFGGPMQCLSNDCPDAFRDRRSSAVRWVTA